MCMSEKYIHMYIVIIIIPSDVITFTLYACVEKIKLS